VTTTIEEAGGRVRFVIAAEDPLYQDRLWRLGYAGIGGHQFATAWFPDSATARACYPRFAMAIEPMVLQKARLVPVPWENALREALRRLEGTDLRWWLYGSVALAVRGFDVDPGDIDLTVDDAAAAGEAFSDLLITPVQELHGWAAALIGRAFHGAIIEWLSEPDPEQDDPAAPNEQGPFVADLLETVEWRGHCIRMPPLWVHLHTCERRGLDEQATLIRAAMRA
jgi:hypothetical protein